MFFFVFEQVVELGLDRCVELEWGYDVVVVVGAVVAFDSDDGPHLPVMLAGIANMHDGDDVVVVRVDLNAQGWLVVNYWSKVDVVFVVVAIVVDENNQKPFHLDDDYPHRWLAHVYTVHHCHVDKINPWIPRHGVDCDWNDERLVKFLVLWCGFGHYLDPQWLLGLVGRDWDCFVDIDQYDEDLRGWIRGDWYDWGWMMCCWGCNSYLVE